MATGYLEMVVEFVLYPNCPLKPDRERAEIRGTGSLSCSQFDSAFRNRTADQSATTGYGCLDVPDQPIQQHFSIDRLVVELQFVHTFGLSGHGYRPGIVDQPVER